MIQDEGYVQEGIFIRVNFQKNKLIMYLVIIKPHLTMDQSLESLGRTSKLIKTRIDYYKCAKLTRESWHQYVLLKQLITCLVGIRYALRDLYNQLMKRLEYYGRNFGIWNTKVQLSIDLLPKLLSPPHPQQGFSLVDLLFR